MQKVIVCSLPLVGLVRTGSRGSTYSLLFQTTTRGHEVYHHRPLPVIIHDNDSSKLQPLCVLLYSKVRLIGAGTAETLVSVFQKLAKAGENHSVTRSRARSRLVHRHDVGCRVSIPCRARERRKRRYSMKMPSLLEILRRMGKVAVGSTGSTVSLGR